MPARSRRILLATGALALALGALLQRPSGRSSGGSSAGSPASALTQGPGFAGAALPANARPHDFTLADLSGRPVSLRSYRGQVLILAFLHSACGPACTLIAQQIRGALDELARPPAVLLVSADPAADTPTRVGRFLASVSLTGRAVYLSGPPRVLEAVWRAYRIIPASSARGAFERSPAVLLLDREGRERVIFALEGLTPEGLAHDVSKLQGQP
jgi:protein SCO1